MENKDSKNLNSENYSCENCGGKLEFNPENNKLTCLYCGSEFEINNISKVNENNIYNVERKLEVVRFKENDIYNIDIYESVLSAANSVNDKSTNISKRCKNNSGLDNPKYKAKGYIFMYKTDYDNFINKHNECT